DVDVEEAGKGILAAHHVFRAGVDVRLPLRPGEGHRAHARGGLADPTVADPVPVDRDALDHGSRARLLFHGIFIVAAAEGVFLKGAVGARSGVATVEANRTAAPLTGEAEVAPRVDGGSVATTQGLGKDRVDLGQGQPLEGVVLVDVDGESVQADAQE